MSDAHRLVLPMSDPRPALEIRRLSKHFGGVHALDSVTLTGLAGEVHGLVGPNGAGKSTLIGCITGLLGIDGGEIVFQGHRIDRSPPHLRARLGIARTFQKIRLAQPLTVFENVAIGCAAGPCDRKAPGGPFGRSLSVRRMLAPLWSGPVAERVDDALQTAGISGSAARNGGVVAVWKTPSRRDRTVSCRGAAPAAP